MAAELGSPSHDKACFIGRGWWLFKELVIGKVVEIAKRTKKLGENENDPRRVYHSAKVGLALILPALFYYYQPIYDSFGDSAIWALITVVTVFEFSVGATLGKIINRSVGTLLGGALALGAHRLATLSGQIGEPIVLVFIVLLQGAASTYVRFFPRVKARYDYGLVIFILTFSMISVSGFHNDEILDYAHKRLSTVLIGSSVCVIISIFISPVWAGEELQNLLALHLEKIAYFLEGFGEEYFTTSEEEDKTEDHKSFMQGYTSVLSSKSAEETLANFARWEPGHGRFKFRHPWKQYLKIGNLIRQCAYRIESLNTNLKLKSKASSKIRIKAKEMCTSVSCESGKALKEVATSLKTMTQPPCSLNIHVANLKIASQDVESLLKSERWGDDDILEVVQVAAVALTLVEIVKCIEKLVESIHELSSDVDFRSKSKTKVNPSEHEHEHEHEHENVICDHAVVMVISESSTDINQYGNKDPISIKGSFFNTFSKF